METINFTPQGVCSRHMSIDVEDGFIRQVRIEGGCNGNLQGLSTLLAGMPVQEAIEKLDGIKCGLRETSCPDQLVRALKGAGK